MVKGLIKLLEDSMDALCPRMEYNYLDPKGVIQVRPHYNSSITIICTGNWTTMIVFNEVSLQTEIMMARYCETVMEKYCHVPGCRGLQLLHLSAANWSSPTA